MKLVAVTVLSTLMLLGGCSSSDANKDIGDTRQDAGAATGDAVDGGTLPPDAADTADAADAADAADGSKPARRCAARSGTFDYTATYLSGDCGTSPLVTAFNYQGCDQIFCLPYAAEAMGETNAAKVFVKCTGTITPSADGCETEYDFTCPMAGGGTTREVGVTKWDAQGTTGTGSAQAITAFNAAGVTTCSGQYQVAIKKK